jgi:hypothetical protein
VAHLPACDPKGAPPALDPQPPGDRDRLAYDLGRLPFWVLIGLFSAFVLAVTLVSEWHRLTSPDNPVQREFWTVNVLLFGALPAYLLVRAIRTVTAEVRSRRGRSEPPSSTPYP